ncbi:MAG: DNA-binding protein [Kaiparowitsia implicata GSE-PSE-MK54-09C]|jgi:predicted DNA-binding protein with PD1-like motif|nr:DNA-binding protein [Kaiparowitsia implicata GSE-PSE-MK54-09C]
MTQRPQETTITETGITALGAIALRLHPQQDLKRELDAFAQRQQLSAACILTCVGSLTQARLRFANQTHPTVQTGHFEIVSLTGVMSIHGSHYHMAIADAAGCIRGGHVMAGCLIYTTAEIVVGVLPQLQFGRSLDPVSGYRELHIEPHPK